MRAWGVPWEITHIPNCFFMNIHKTKYLLCSWRMSWSEFSKALIWENFPETTDNYIWGKAHVPLQDNLLNALLAAETKIIFVMCDPRDASTHIINHQNGTHFHPDDYPPHIAENPHSVEFLNENTKIIINLLDFYSKHFNGKMVVLKYEDAVNNQPVFLKRVSDFLQIKPFGVNLLEKYSAPIYKGIGVYKTTFNDTIVNQHIQEYESHYRRWGYLK